MAKRHHSKVGPLRRIIGFLFLAAAIAAVLGAVASTRAVADRDSPEQVAAMRKIAPWVTEHTADGKQAEFMVVLADQADLSGAAALSAKTEKGRFVRDALLNKSQTTQGPILQFLRDRGIEHRSFYIVNAILVKGGREIAETLAARPDVARVEGNPHIKNSLPQPESTVEAPSQPDAPATIEPGIVYTHAPSVWAEGFTGQNIVIASADTGVRWTHNALKPHYRGWDGLNADHNYNWHDSIHDSVGNPCGNNSPVPCDDFFHGSHTTGNSDRRRSRRPTRSGWRLAQSGLPAVTWTRAQAHQPDTSSAWNFSWRLIRWGGRATRARHPMLQLTPGVARLRKVVRSQLSNPLSKLKPLLAS